jgi:hypothetical protein
MHTCPPPTSALRAWLKEYPSTVGRYGHLLLEQHGPGDQVAGELRPYFESAHRDAREHFHSVIGIDLHPDAEETGSHVMYPGCLPATARRGLFGEVMAGLVTENYQFVGRHRWAVPIFLFRYHADVETYLFSLARDPSRSRAVFGRFGSDFVGIALGDDGSAIRFIAGEAKWRQKLQPSVVEELLHGEWVKNEDGSRARSGKGIWYEVNRDIQNPLGMRQLQLLLKAIDPAQYSAAILSMDKALLLKDPAKIPRTDLVLIAGNDVPSRKSGLPLIPWQRIPPEYTVGNDLQVVELILQDGDSVIDSIYDTLYTSDS